MVDTVFLYNGGGQQCDGVCGILRRIFPTNGFVSYRCNRQTQLVRRAHLRLFQAFLPNALPYTGVSIPRGPCVVAARGSAPAPQGSHPVRATLATSKKK